MQGLSDQKSLFQHDQQVSAIKLKSHLYHPKKVLISPGWFNVEIFSFNLHREISSLMMYRLRKVCVCLICEWDSKKYFKSVFPQVRRWAIVMQILMATQISHMDDYNENYLKTSPIWCGAGQIKTFSQEWLSLYRNGFECSFDHIAKSSLHPYNPNGSLLMVWPAIAVRLWF